MNIIYSHRGFPVHINVQPTLGSVYESPRVSDIYRQRCEQTRPTFEQELAQVAVLLKEWKYTGGFFRAALEPTCRLGAGVQSFIAETALFLTKQITRRRVSFQDRALMIKQDSVVATRLPSFSDVERQAVEELAQYTPDALIQMWVSTIGMDDLSQSLELYVGDRTTQPTLQ